MFLSTFIVGCNRWLCYRETVRELSGLTNRELNDLGIQRSDITAVAKGGR